MEEVRTDAENPREDDEMCENHCVREVNSIDRLVTLWKIMMFVRFDVWLSTAHFRHHRVLYM